MIALKILLSKKTYLHLNISVNVKIESVINDFWNELLNKFDLMMNKWIALRLSQRARVKILIVLLMLISCYAINHLWLFKKHKSKLNKMMQRLIWEKNFIHESIEMTRLSVERRDFDVQNLNFIKHTSTVIWMTKMNKRLKFLWMQLTRSLLMNFKTQRIHLKKVYAS